MSWHVPHQHRSRHRCQPSWWSNIWPGALPAMVFGGIFADDCSRFARMVFRRTVRRCQRTFWAHWQECLASISRSCPRVVASMVRRTLGPSHRHPDRRCQCRQLAPAFLFRWRPLLQCFDDEFEEVSQRFHVIDSQPVVPGLFDAPFTPAELRRVLTLCLDSAVGFDGVLCVQNESPLVAISSPPLLQSRPLLGALGPCENWPFSSLVQSVGERSCCRSAALCTWCPVFPLRGSPPLSTPR